MIYAVLGMRCNVVDYKFIMHKLGIIDVQLTIAEVLQTMMLLNIRTLYEWMLMISINGVPFRFRSYRGHPWVLKGVGRGRLADTNQKPPISMAHACQSVFGWVYEDCNCTPCRTSVCTKMCLLASTFTLLVPPQFTDPQNRTMFDVLPQHNNRGSAFGIRHTAITF